MEILLGALAEAVFGVIIGDIATRPGMGKIREYFAGDSPEKLAFKLALANTYSAFNKRYPALSPSFFDEYFLQDPQIAEELAKTLTPNQHPEIEKLERIWKTQFFSSPNISISKPLEYFIEQLNSNIKSRPELRDFSDAKNLERIAQHSENQTELLTQIRDLQKSLLEVLKQPSASIRNLADRGTNSDPEMKHVFLSYARLDGSSFAKDLETSLAKAKIRTWRDVREIEPTKDFTSEIEDAIRHSSHVIVCITADIQQSAGLVNREIQYAILTHKLIIVAIFEKGIQPPQHIINYPHIDFSQNWNTAINDLLKVIVKPHENDVQISWPEEMNDPLRPYLERLYERIVDFLDRTVITLLDLVSEDQSRAIERPIRKNDMFDQFYMSQGFDDGWVNDGRIFSKFGDAFQAYEGDILLLGAPGAGKTITLMSFCRDAVVSRLSDPTKPIPFLGLIPTWVPRKGEETITSIARWISSGYSELSISDVSKALYEQEAILLLDGLDELGEQAAEEEEGKKNKIYDPRARFLELMEEIKKTAPGNSLLVTCRSKDYFQIGQKGKFRGAVTLHLLNDVQMEEYLFEQPHLLAAIESDPELKEMLRTPLIMSLFAFAYRDRGEEAKKLRNLRNSPDDLRAEIIDTYIRKRYFWDARKHDVALSLDELKTILGLIACEDVGRFSRRNVFSEDTFATVLAQSSTQDFAELVVRLHIMVRHEIGTLRFIHLLIRDYFAFIGALTKLKREDKSHRLHGLEVLTELVDRRGVQPLIDALEDEDVEVRRSVVGALGKFADIRAVEPLITQLEDEDVEVRRLATLVLGNLHDKRAVQPLIWILDDMEALVRGHAATALGQLGDIRAVEPLINALEDEEVEVRRSVVGALGALRNTRAVEPLIARLEDEDVEVRRLATLVLGNLHDKRAVQPLIWILDDMEAIVRSHAATALGQLGDIRAVEPLITSLNDSNVEVRRNAVRSLGILADRRAIEPLIGCLQDSDKYIQQDTSDILGKYCDARAIEPLIPLLIDFDEGVRKHASAALMKFGALAVEPLIRTLNSNKAELRWRVEELLMKIGDRRSVVPLIKLLADADDRVRQSAVVALKGFMDSTVVEILISHMDDPSDSVRRSLIEVLGSSGDKRVVNLLTIALSDPDRRVRKRAAEALKKFRWAPTCEEEAIRYCVANQEWTRCVDFGNPAVPILLSFLADRDSDIRRCIALVLGEICDPQAIDPLIQTLADSSEWVCRSAAESLSNFGQSAIDPLVSAILTSRALIVPFDEKRQHYAFDALRLIGTPEAFEAIRKLR